ncbi:DEAD/DEAH box helicase [Lujinxingia litoralis]|nr:DEAD/DEAH box helicase [Lujinxingia litoralis]
MSTTVDAAASVPTSTFDQLGLSAPILNAVTDAGYDTPTPIQAGAIPLLLAGHDIIGQARTGTGKTAAFALPMLDAIDLSERAVQGLILTPTRELAVQIAEAMESYARHRPGLTILPVYGGASMMGQLHALRRGVHVVVGTPGRVLDHLRRQSLRLDKVQALVLDEADEMLRMGFIDDVETILEATPTERRTALFSATMPRAIETVARKHLREPQSVTIESHHRTTIEQRFIRLRYPEKFFALDRLLRASDHEGVLVFAQRRADTEEIAQKLCELGHRAQALNGDLGQQQRELVLHRLRERQLDVVVGTDVAARGLDVDHLSLVVNYDLPFDVDTYTHRVGRTGRAGREGLAVSLVSNRQMAFIRQVERQMKVSVKPMQVPSAADVEHRAAEIHAARLREILVAKSPELSPHYNLVKALVDEGFHMTEVAAAASLLAAGDTLKPPTLADLNPIAPSSHRNSGGNKKSRSSRHRGRSKGRGSRSSKSSRGPRASKSASDPRASKSAGDERNERKDRKTSGRLATRKTRKKVSHRKGQSPPRDRD